MDRIIKTKEEIVDIINLNRGKTAVCKECLSGRVLDDSLFSRSINGLANHLIKDPNEEIIISEENSISLLLMYFAAMFAGKTIVPIDPQKTDDEINIIRSIHTKATYYGKGDIGGLIEKIDLGIQLEYLKWEAVDFEKVYLITYTSGSVGQPKGVKHSIYNLFLSGYEFGTTLKYDSSTVMGHCMPMTYMAGILNTIITPYIMGGMIIIMPRFSVVNSFSFWSIIQQEKINTLWLSPTMLRLIEITDKRGEMRSYLNESGMKISVGTAPLDLNLRNLFEKKYDIRLYQSYGLSETLFLTTEDINEVESAHTVGKPLPGVEIDIAADSELIVRVPWMFKGYTNECTEDYMREESYCSGDIGVWKDNNLIITGRVKDLIVKGGYNINPRDIENVILTNDKVTECAVVPFEYSGEELIAAVIVSDANVGLNEINDMIVSALGNHYCVDYLEKVRSLNKNLNGKIDRLKIKKYISAQYGVKS